MCNLHSKITSTLEMLKVLTGFILQNFQVERKVLQHILKNRNFLKSYIHWKHITQYTLLAYRAVFPITVH